MPEVFRVKIFFKVLTMKLFVHLPNWFKSNFDWFNFRINALSRISHKDDEILFQNSNIEEEKIKKIKRRFCSCNEGLGGQTEEWKKVSRWKKRKKTRKKSRDEDVKEKEGEWSDEQRVDEFRRSKDCYKKLN